MLLLRLNIRAVDLLKPLQQRICRLEVVVGCSGAATTTSPFVRRLNHLPHAREQVTVAHLRMRWLLRVLFDSLNECVCACTGARDTAGE